MMTIFFFATLVTCILFLVFLIAKMGSLTVQYFIIRNTELATLTAKHEELIQLYAHIANDKTELERFAQNLQVIIERQTLELAHLREQLDALGSETLHHQRSLSKLVQ